MPKLSEGCTSPPGEGGGETSDFCARKDVSFGETRGRGRGVCVCVCVFVCVRVREGGCLRHIPTVSVSVLFLIRSNPSLVSRVAWTESTPGSKYKINLDVVGGKRMDIFFRYTTYYETGVFRKRHVKFCG